jgi:alginate O-acetyltransferase complex protein AlgI
MLFNSYPFLLAFYPVTFFVFFLVGWRNRGLAAAWLGLASLFFYGYWSVAALPLLIASICMNYWFGLRVTPTPDTDPAAEAAQRTRRLRLYAAVALNLGVLAYFKYANFFIGNINIALHAASAAELHALHVVLPIGISFFTFTQITFLVDCYEGKVHERNFIHYLLFVSYFPHLISGPVLHHSQMMPQFRRPETYRLQANNILTGLFNVAVGLAKKVLFADEFSQYATPIFDAARDGQHLGYVAAWTGVLAYTLQIYFDFSGYSDMAIGLSRMLGIALPLNFNAPYKATSIIEFWRRWHISLSQFLRDYLYVRLGGNRLGAARRYSNLMLTMLLGGLWHGASWTFVVWGGLHGTYLLINHAWRAAAPALPHPGRVVAALGTWLGAALTFLGVVVAWVFFRSATFDAAGRLLQAMIRFEPMRCGANCFDEVFRDLRIPPTSFGYLGGFFLAGFAVVWFLPTSQASTRHMLEVRGNRAWIFAGALLFCVSLLAVINASHSSSEFIYFNF